MKKFLVETEIELDIPEEIKDKHFIKLVVMKKMTEILTETVIEQVEADLVDYFEQTDEEMAEHLHLGEINEFANLLEEKTNFAGSLVIANIVEEGALDFEYEAIG